MNELSVQVFANRIYIARAIQDQLLKDFAQRSDFSNWFSRDEDDAPKEAVILKPNPRNMELDEKLTALDARIKRYTGNDVPTWSECDLLTRPVQFTRREASMASHTPTTARHAADIHVNRTASENRATRL